MEVGLTKDSLKTLLPMTGTDANRIGEVMMEFANSVQECPCPPSCLEVTRFRFCHIILIHMEPFELAHRPVDVFNMRVTFFFTKLG